MLRFLFASLALLTTLTANAANWYVATNGNDSNVGSLAAPFATINQTENVISAGDTVYVRGGVYNQHVSLWTNGTSTARITYRPYGDERVILDGTGLVDSNGNPEDVVALGGNYVDWIGFEIRNAANVGLVGWGGHDQKFLNNTVHDCVRGGIWVGEDSFNLVSNILISGNRVYNNVLENKARNWNGGWAQSIGVSHAANVTITNNIVYRNYGEGIVLGRTDSSTISNNEVFDNYSANIYLSHVQTTVVDSNLVYSTLDTHYYRTPTYTHPANGILLANETNWVDTNVTSGNDIINNIVLRAEWGLGFWKDTNETSVNSMTNVRFANNTVYAATRHALHIDADTNHTGVVVENNIFNLPSGSTASLYSVPSSAPGISYRYNNWSATVASPVTNANDVIAADPKFVLAGGSNATDYKILSTSPVKNMGVTISYVTKDYWLKTRSGSYDMGAHEY